MMERKPGSRTASLSFLCALRTTLSVRTRRVLWSSLPMWRGLEFTDSSQLCSQATFREVHRDCTEIALSDGVKVVGSRTSGNIAMARICGWQVGLCGGTCKPGVAEAGKGRR